MVIQGYAIKLCTKLVSETSLTTSITIIHRPLFVSVVGTVIHARGECPARLLAPHKSLVTIIRQCDITSTCPQCPFVLYFTADCELSVVLLLKFGTKPTRYSFLFCGAPTLGVWLTVLTEKMKCFIRWLYLGTMRVVSSRRLFCLSCAAVCSRVRTSYARSILGALCSKTSIGKSLVPFL